MLKKQLANYNFLPKVVKEHQSGIFLSNVTFDKSRVQETLKQISDFQCGPGGNFHFVKNNTGRPEGPMISANYSEIFKAQS